jgi:hypothetical protein
MALVGLFSVGCGHEQVTGSAKNDWNTPTGYATATNPRYVNPMDANRPARDRSVFAKREAPTLQPNAGSAIEQPAPVEVPPPTATPQPPLDAAPDIQTPNTAPGGIEAPPPYVLPPP